MKRRLTSTLRAAAIRKLLQQRTATIRRLLENSYRDPETGCRIWTGRVHNRKARRIYGQMNVRVEGQHVTVYVHRVAHSLALGRVVRSDLDSDHCCCESLCIEPLHLAERTPRRNSQLAHERRRPAP